MNKAKRGDTTKAGKSIITKNLGQPATESEKRLEALLKVAPSGIVIIEKADGRISYVNNRAIELYGVDPTGLELGNHSTKKLKLLALDGSTYPPEMLPASRALLKGETVYNEEVIIEQPTGKRIAVAASATPVLDSNGEITAAVGIFHDITFYKQMEDYHQERREQLEETVRQRDEKLSEADEELRQEIGEHKQARNRVRGLSLPLINAEEKERRKVGHELHDQVGGSLTLLKMATHKAKQAPAEKIGETIEEIEKIADEIYEEVRNLSHSLRPDMLDELGLAEALGAHFEDYTDRCGIKVSFEYAELEKRLPSEIEITAFRIVQETLANVARHANASEVTVVLTCQGDVLRLEIRDNGCGFDPAEIGLRSSGISGMQDRAYLAGGTLTVDSSPGSGTGVSCELPVMRRQKDGHRNKKP
ncbi:MAG: PAS domain-containing sensor histidine kinase [Chloroflexota bacterium]